MDKEQMMSQPESHVAIAIPTPQGDPENSTCWYVLGILSSIFCCCCCGLIGLMHVMTAKHEALRGNMQEYKGRMFQGKCWVSWAIGVGVLIIVAYLWTWIVFVFPLLYEVGYGRRR